MKFLLTSVNAAPDKAQQAGDKIAKGYKAKSRHQFLYPESHMIAEQPRYPADAKENETPYNRKDHMFGRILIKRKRGQQEEHCSEKEGSQRGIGIAVKRGVFYAEFGHSQNNKRENAGKSYVVECRPPRFALIEAIHFHAQPEEGKNQQNQADDCSDGQNAEVGNQRCDDDTEFQRVYKNDFLHIL